MKRCEISCNKRFYILYIEMKSQILNVLFHKLKGFCLETKSLAFFHLLILTI